jgi:hypothetical protein
VLIIHSAAWAVNTPWLLQPPMLLLLLLLQLLLLLLLLVLPGHIYIELQTDATCAAASLLMPRCWRHLLHVLLLQSVVHTDMHVCDLAANECRLRWRLPPGLGSRSSHQRTSPRRSSSSACAAPAAPADSSPPPTSSRRDRPGDLTRCTAHSTHSTAHGTHMMRLKASAALRQS